MDSRRMSQTYNPEMWHIYLENIFGRKWQLKKNTPDNEFIYYQLIDI